MAGVTEAPVASPRSSLGKRAPWALLVVIFEVLAIAGPIKMLVRGKPDGAGAGVANQVNMAGLVFAPETLTVDRGSVVTFVNDDIAPHTVTANDNSVDSGTLKPGATFTLTVNQKFEYFCAIHPDMVATVEVGG